MTIAEAPRPQTRVVGRDHPHSLPVGSGAPGLRIRLSALTHQFSPKSMIQQILGWKHGGRILGWIEPTESNAKTPAHVDPLRESLLGRGFSLQLP